LYYKNNPSEKNIYSGIISLRAVSKGLLTTVLGENKNINSGLLMEFELQLKTLLSKIFDPAVPFTQTPKLITCVYCSFKNICNR
jgi:hypothetical protein